MSTRVKKSVSRRRRAPAKNPPGSRSSAEAYAHFLPDAEAIPQAQVQSCRIDPALALHNVQLGVANVLPQEARLRKGMPTLNLDDLHSLSDLAAGLIYAADRQSGPPSKADVADKLQRLRKLREPMLLIAEGLALQGLLPSEKVTAIRQGNGHIDMARDGIALEALYREHAATLHNKHPFSDADLKEAADLGNHLVRAITPNGGRQRPEPQDEATQLRDRFYTLLTQRHAELRKAGFFLFGEAVNDYVPTLATRVRQSRSPGSNPSPTPTPAPSPTPTPSAKPAAA